MHKIRLLRDQRQMLAERVNINTRDVHAIEKNLTPLRLIEPLKQRYDTRLPATRRSDKSCEFPLLYRHIQSVDDRGFPSRVPQADITELDFDAALRIGDIVFRGLLGQSGLSGVEDAI